MTRSFPKLPVYENRIKLLRYLHAPRTEINLAGDIIRGTLPNTKMETSIHKFDYVLGHKLYSDGQQFSIASLSNNTAHV